MNKFFLPYFLLFYFLFAFLAACTDNDRTSKGNANEIRLISVKYLPSNGAWFYLNNTGAVYSKMEIKWIKNLLELRFSHIETKIIEKLLRKERFTEWSGDDLTGAVKDFIRMRKDLIKDIKFSGMKGMNYYKARLSKPAFLACNESGISLQISLNKRLPQVKANPFMINLTRKGLQKISMVL